MKRRLDDAQSRPGGVKIGGSIRSQPPYSRPLTAISSLPPEMETALLTGLRQKIADHVAILLQIGRVLRTGALEKIPRGAATNLSP